MNIKDDDRVSAVALVVESDDPPAPSQDELEAQEQSDTPSPDSQPAGSA